MLLPADSLRSSFALPSPLTHRPPPLSPEPQHAAPESGSSPRVDLASVPTERWPLLPELARGLKGAQGSCARSPKLTRAENDR